MTNAAGFTFDRTNPGSKRNHVRRELNSALRGRYTNFRWVIASVGPSPFTLEGSDANSMQSQEQTLRCTKYGPIGAKVYGSCHRQPSLPAALASPARMFQSLRRRPSLVVMKPAMQSHRICGWSLPFGNDEPTAIAQSMHLLPIRSVVQSRTVQTIVVIARRSDRRCWSQNRIRRGVRALVPSRMQYLLPDATLYDVLRKGYQVWSISTNMVTVTWQARIDHLAGRRSAADSERGRHPPTPNPCRARRAKSANQAKSLQNCVRQSSSRSRMRPRTPTSAPPRVAYARRGTLIQPEGAVSNHHDDKRRTTFLHCCQLEGSSGLAPPSFWVLLADRQRSHARSGHLVTSRRPEGLGSFQRPA